jgi:hypothetical protein
MRMITIQLTNDSLTTVEQAQTWLQNNIRSGAICPCCKQHAKIYKRKLSTAMVRALVTIYKYLRDHPEFEWVHVSKFITMMPGNSSAAGGDLVKLRYWDLIQPGQGDNARVGRYKLTAVGRQFVEGKISVASHVYVFNSLVLNQSESKLTIREALGPRFEVLLEGI